MLHSIQSILILYYIHLSNDKIIMSKKLTYRYAFTLLKMKNAKGRNEYIDLAKEENLIWHKIVSEKSKNTHIINCGG